MFFIHNPFKFLPKQRSNFNCKWFERGNIHFHQLPTNCRPILAFSASLSIRTSGEYQELNKLNVFYKIKVGYFNNVTIVNDVSDHFSYPIYTVATVKIYLGKRRNEVRNFTAKNKEMKICKNRRIFASSIK